MEKVLEGMWEVLGAEKRYELAINSDGQTFSVKVQMVNSVTHVGCAISVTTFQLCHFIAKVTIDNKMNRYVYMCSQKILFTETGNGIVWLACFSLLNPVIKDWENKCIRKGDQTSQY